MSRRRALVLPLAAALVAAAGAAAINAPSHVHRGSAFERPNPDGDPAWAPDGTRIAFARSERGRWRLRVLDLRTRRERVLVAGGSTRDETTPAWSRDGTRIAFTSGEGCSLESRSDILIVNSDGTGLRTLNVGRLSACNPSWSPDDSRLVFAAHLTGFTTELWTVQSDGTRLARLASANDSLTEPAWSPDGSRIAFAGESALYVMNADGTGRRTIVANDRARSPAWSPDGRRIAYVYGHSGLVGPSPVGGIRIVNADGTGRRTLVRRAGGQQFPSWSPDGGRVAFAGDPDVCRRYAVWTIRADGSGLRRLTKRSCRIFGTNRADTLRGTPYRDVIDGRGGADRIFGRGGPDDLYGGRGNDLVAGSGALFGGPGRDRLAGRPGYDEIYARDGARDTISCGRETRGEEDLVVVDRFDRVARDCRRVRRPPQRAASLPDRADNAYRKPDRARLVSRARGDEAARR